MKLYKLWNKRRPRRLGMIPVWTGFLTLLIALLSFQYLFSLDFMRRDVTFYVIDNRVEQLNEYIYSVREYIPYEYHEQYGFCPWPQDIGLVERGIEIYGVGSYPKSNKGWTLRYFGDRARSEKHARTLFPIIRSMLRKHFKDNEALRDYYKKGRIEYSTASYNLYAKENKFLTKYPEEIYEVWLGYNY